MIDDFFSDLKRYGGARATIRLDHRERLVAFRRRQIELIVLAAWFALLFALTGYALFLILIVLFAQTGAGETRRMRACGRSRQCRRSIEVIGE